MIEHGTELTPELQDGFIVHELHSYWLENTVHQPRPPDEITFPRTNAKTNETALPSAKSVCHKGGIGVLVCAA